MYELTKDFAKAAGAPFGKCIEYGASIESWFTTLHSQVTRACNILKEDKDLNGKDVSVVGLSQGNLVARGIIQSCDAVNVKNYVSVAGPHSGTSTMPQCETGFICDMINKVIDFGVYSSIVQGFIAPANYFKDVTQYDTYLKDAAFLPDFNNERETKNDGYKQKFAALERLVLIKYNNDTVLSPIDTEWFQFYTAGKKGEILPIEQTPLYAEDWIGLKSLNEAGKVKFVAQDGNHLSHLDMDDPLVTDYIIPALKANTKTNLRTIADI
jgi:palmitoyl-protein thioesterase